MKTTDGAAFDLEPGAYPFICTTPGHFTMMQGVMTVKARPAP